MLRNFTLILLILLFQYDVHGQILKGKIIDSKTSEPIEYACIGIINTNYGTITDSKGCFQIEAKGQDLSSIVRISMIGYEARMFTVEELDKSNNTIALVQTAIEFDEVIIKPTKERNIGAIGYNRLAGWSGWGGMHNGKGCEMGIILNLGNHPVKIKTFHVLLHRQAFDTIFCRMHIRAIKDTLVLDELLSENIILTITNESGWVKIDLEQCNLIMSGEIALTLEWLKVQGINEDREMKINNRMQKAYILFKNKKNQTGLFRWGTEARWILRKDDSPSMYLTIME